MSRMFQESAAVAPASGDGTLDLREFMGTVLRRKWLVLGVAIVVVALAAAYSYSSEGLLLDGDRPGQTHPRVADRRRPLGQPEHADRGRARPVHTRRGDRARTRRATAGSAGHAPSGHRDDSGEHADPPDLVHGLHAEACAEWRAGVRGWVPAVQARICPAGDRGRRRDDPGRDRRDRFRDARPRDRHARDGGGLARAGGGRVRARLVGGHQAGPAESTRDDEHREHGSR